MMIGKSWPEYVFTRTAIAALRLVAPLSILYLIYTLLAAPPHQLERVHYCLLTFASFEAAFFLCVYLPRRYHLQKANGNHPMLSRDERRALFQRCSASLGTAAYPFQWFRGSGPLHRQNLVEWLLWALFSASPHDARQEAWRSEIDAYIAVVERALGHTFPEGYNPKVSSMRLTLDPLRMTHRPLLWYLIVGVLDAMTGLRLYWHGFRHYSDTRWFRTFPPRPLALFSRASEVDGLSYWYRPHRAHAEKHPVLFLHGIGIGLLPYAGFLADLAARHPGVGILVPEFLSISGRISPAPRGRAATVRAIAQLLDVHAHARVVIAAHSYGTAIATQLFHAWGGTGAGAGTPSPSALSPPRIAAMLLIDPIVFLLHLPDVAFNFVYRAPRTANERMLSYFASRDPDVARTLGRHFFWAENVLWRDELLLSGCEDGDGDGGGVEVAVALSEYDQVVNSGAVWRYLTGGADEGQARDWRGGRLEVLWYPGLDHAMIFNVAQRWGRLLRVLDRFVHAHG